MLHRRNSASGDHVEAEQAARAARRSAEKLEKEAAEKQKQFNQPAAPRVEWGSNGVASLLSDDVDVVSDPSPDAKRAAQTPPSNKKSSVAVGSYARKPQTTSLGWGPQVPTSPSATATDGATLPYPVGESMEQAVQFLTESLQAERKRSDDLEARRQQLEAANAALREELRVTQDKAFKAMFPVS